MGIRFIAAALFALFLMLPTQQAVAAPETRQSFAPGEFQVASFFRGNPCPEGERKCNSRCLYEGIECFDFVEEYYEWPSKEYDEAIKGCKDDLQECYKKCEKKCVKK